MLQQPIVTKAVWFQQDETLYSPEYLLVMPLNEGISLHGSETTNVEPGTLLFLSPFSENKLHIRAGCRVLYGLISSSFLEEYIGIPRRASVVLLQDGSNTAKEKLISLFDLQHNYQSTDILDETCTSFELLRALKPSILNFSVDSMDSTASANRHTQIAAYMQAHFREPIQLGDLADAFGLSKPHLSMVFHRELGLPFSDYLLNLRLKEAARLLLTTDKNITTICQNSGFPNLKSFNQSFRNKYNLTPKEFRKKNNSDSIFNLTASSAQTLQNANQLLNTYRLLYPKSDEAVSLTDTIRTGDGNVMVPKWNDILNIDNPAECLQSIVQSTLTQMQGELHFRYVRICNFFTYELVPYIASLNQHRFTYLFQLIDFFKKLGLTPMPVFGDTYQVMLDAVMINDGAYSISEKDWLEMLEAMLNAAISRWGKAWVSTWRFEFHMPESLYGESNYDRFMDLFSHSFHLIRRLLPDAEIGGPSIAIDSDHLPRWNAWFQGLQSKGLNIDFISAELWAEYSQKVDSFSGQFGIPKEIRTIKSVDNIDTTVSVQKIHSLRKQMQKNGLSEKKLYISAIGVTKYQANAAQIAGHCAAHLTKMIMEIHSLVDGIGCWKALNCEAEYYNDSITIGTGCGLASRYGLKNINWYAYHFMNHLLPYQLFQGLNCLVTTDRNNCYSVLVHNCKKYSNYFCNNYLNQVALEFWNSKMYTSSSALQQTIRIVGVKPQNYLVKQLLIGNRHGCIASVIQNMGQFQKNSEDEILYIAGQSMPYQHTFMVEASDILEFTVTLQPNEVMLLLISPEHCE